jgi:hypothetical protein
MTRPLALFVIFAAACGQSAVQPVQQPPPTSATPATTLTYTDPTTDGWRLVQDPASTPTHLLLDLVGPSGFMTRGAAFNMKLPPGLRPRAFAETNHPVKDLGVYQLYNTQPKNGVRDPQEPVLLAGVWKPGGLLSVGVFQKDRRESAKDSGAPLFQIAIELDPATPINSGTRLPLLVSKSKYIAEDIGVFNPNGSFEMMAKAHLQDFIITVGDLRAD